MLGSDTTALRSRSASTPAPVPKSWSHSPVASGVCPTPWQRDSMTTTWGLSRLMRSMRQPASAGTVEFGWQGFVVETRSLARRSRTVARSDSISASSRIAVTCWSTRSWGWWKRPRSRMRLRLRRRRPTRTSSRRAFLPRRMRGRLPSSSTAGASSSDPTRRASGYATVSASGIGTWMRFTPGSCGRRRGKAPPSTVHRADAPTMGAAPITHDERGFQLLHGRSARARLSPRRSTRNRGSGPMRSFILNAPPACSTSAAYRACWPRRSRAAPRSRTWSRLI